MERSPAKAPQDGDVTEVEVKLDFDDNTLRAIAEVYKNEGNDAYKRNDFNNAVHFYTEGIKVSCKDDELNAKLYSNRATAYFYLGNYHESLNDAKAALELQPTYIKPMARGASVCVELHRYEEAITWCNKGLAINRTNKMLSDLRITAVNELNKLKKPKQEEKLQYPLVKGQKSSELLLLVDRGHAHFSLFGNSFYKSGEFETAIKWHKFCLKIAEEAEWYRSEQGRLYGNIGSAYYRLLDFQKAIDYYKRSVEIAKEIEDRSQEGRMYSNLGNAYYQLRDFIEASNYHKRCLKFAKEVKDKSQEGQAYGNLGNAYYQLGDFKQAIDCHELCLKIAKEVGDKTEQLRTYCNLGNVFFDILKDYKKAIACRESYLNIAKEVGNKVEEECAYGNLGHAYLELGDFTKAIDFYELSLKISKEVGDRIGEAISYGHLGNAYQDLKNFPKAVDYHELALQIAKEVGNGLEEGRAYIDLGTAYERLGEIQKATDCFQRGLKLSIGYGARAEELRANLGLGITFCSLGDFKKALPCFESCLEIIEKLGDKKEEGKVYGYLGTTNCSLGDTTKGRDYLERSLKVAQDVGNRQGEGNAYGRLGDLHCQLEDFKKSVDCYELQLQISKEVGDKFGEGIAYGRLGFSHCNIGSLKKAVEYQKLSLKISKEIGNWHDEGRTYINLAISHRGLEDFNKAIEYSKSALQISKDREDKATEGDAYVSLGNAYAKLGKFKDATDYFICALKICQEMGNKLGEGQVYLCLGKLYHCLKDFDKAKDHCERALKISKEEGSRVFESLACHFLGRSLESLGFLDEAANCFESSTRMMDNVRTRLKLEDKWKINLRNTYQPAYASLWRVLLKLEKPLQAMLVAERGRAQALNDFMELRYGQQSLSAESHAQGESDYDILNSIPSKSVFAAIDEQDYVCWVFQNKNDVTLRRRNISDMHFWPKDRDMTIFIECLVTTACDNIGLRAGVNCEDRSLDVLRDDTLPSERSEKESHTLHAYPEKLTFFLLYMAIIGPIADLIHGDELIIVPEGPLWLAPFAAFVDCNLKYLSESFRIRLIPSLTSLKLILTSPDDYHSKTGSLLVGDPWVQEVIINDRGQKLDQLPYAKREVEMIGRILNTAPLTGKEATKNAVLKRLPTVALVHIAAHGRMETGEIALCPNPSRASQVPKDEDFILTISDVMNVKLTARLVVLSCCHSGRGDIKAEGVVGIARAFLGAGARSVLVSLWAIDDEATLQFMKYFYQHLVEGKSASESLNRAMKCMRESDKFKEVKYWAPFVLVGDDVTLDFHRID